VKNTAKSEFLDFVLDQLRAVDDLQAKRMFGGWGVYAGDIFFGIVHDDRFYMKTDDASRSEYESRGSGPFQPNEKQTLKTYYEVPAEILESREQLTIWARRAIQSQESQTKKL